VKLRVRGNSVRLRVTQSEVLALGRGQRVEDEVHFSPADRLCYALECGGDRVSASFTSGCVLVRVPVAMAREWSASERVGLAAVQPIGPDRALSILIEKDFACLTHRAGEEDVDAFPNPNERC